MNTTGKLVTTDEMTEVLHNFFASVFYQQPFFPHLSRRWTGGAKRRSGLQPPEEPKHT